MDSLTHELGRYGRHVAWINRNLECFVRAPRENPAGLLARIQRLGELAFIYRARVRFERTMPADQRSSSTLTRWREVLIEGVNDDEVRLRSRRYPHETFAWLIPYIILRELEQYADEWHDNSLSIARSLGYPSIIEAVPYRYADHLYTLRLAGEDIGSQLDDALCRTYLAAMPSSAYATRESIYSATHTVLYASDFGTRLTTELWLSSPETIRFLEGALLRTCRRKDWDLAGELLISMRVIPSAFSEELVKLATSAFHDAELPDGAVLPSAETGAALQHLPHEQSINRFEALYHTTLVAILLEAAPRRADVSDFRVEATRFEMPPLVATQLDAAIARAFGFLSGKTIELQRRVDPDSHSFGWKEAFIEDRVRLMRLLGSRAPRVVDVRALGALVQSLISENDYSSLLGALNWYIDLNIWDVPATEAMLHLLNHQTESGSIGLFAEGLRNQSTVEDLQAHLTDRFARLLMRAAAASRNGK